MDLTALLVLVLLVALTAILWPRDDRRRSLLNKLPGPLALPGFGTSWRLLLTQRRAVFRNFHAMTLRHWPLFRAWTGPYPEVHINKPEHVEKIMSSMDFIEKGRSYDFLHPWLGQGLLTSTGAKWHSHRKMITPAFHFKILDNFVEVFGEKSQILVEKLKQQSGTKVFDIYPFIARCALDIICETAMGTPVNAQQNTKSEYVSAVYSISELTIARILRPWLYNDFIFRLTSTGKQYYKDLDILHSFTNRVIRERKALRKRNDDPTKNLEQDDLDIGRKKRMAFLDLLLEASDGGTKLSDVEIREEVDTFMFEGHDTTAVGMSWALLLLGHHPEVQEKVYEEMQSIFQGSDRAPTMQDLQEMKYLEMVIKEALRLYPSVPFIARKLLKETDLGGYTIPAGTTVVLHIYHIHRDPDHWTDPERFDPDRFLPDRAQARHPYAHVPFSGGPRNCIGQKFATLEEKAVLSSIVRNFRVKSQMKREDLDLVGELVLRPLNGVVVQLTPR